jgi:trehalose 6-phosphate synthase/phosphatase
LSLILLANRPPIRPTPEGHWAPALGGLATALLPVLIDRGGAWVSMQDPGEEAPIDQPYPEEAPRFHVRRIPLTEEEHDLYYLGMANRVLWPLAHYLVDHVEPDRTYWEAYRAVNRRFAKTALEVSDPDDVFWVQDYQLMLVPGMLRAARPNARIGHFWHIPWPAPEVFRIVPSARNLIRGMLGADVVGFHTEGYAENFREGARDLLGARLVRAEEGDGYDVLFEGRRIHVGVFPIGIDVESFATLGDAPDTATLAGEVRREAAIERLVVGVDRLDYTKGLMLRLEAFERFLETHPEWHHRVSLFQVCTPSRTGIPAYDQLRRDVDEIVGRINGRFADSMWVPVRYRYRSLGQDELAVLYRAADVALVTPLRDGMNLVAHEFIAASERGVLLLSELTGAADYLDGAVLVNPYDTDGLVQALHTALDLPQDERRARMERLKASVKALDVHGWADRYLAALDAVPPSLSAPRPGAPAAEAPAATGPVHGPRGFRRAARSRFLTACAPDSRRPPAAARLRRHARAHRLRSRRRVSAPRRARPAGRPRRAHARVPAHRARPRHARHPPHWARRAPGAGACGGAARRRRGGCRRGGDPLGVCAARGGLQGAAPLGAAPGRHPDRGKGRHRLRRPLPGRARRGGLRVGAGRLGGDGA